MISRDPIAATKEIYDLIVVGGGIYGSMLALAASRRGLQVLLIERGDFGEATSYNSLRIIHGGLRYLQGLDLRRFREFVVDRRWFLRNFPDLVKPLPCLMPLYNRAMRRPSVLYVALLINDLLASRRNKGIELGSQVPRGRVVNPGQTCAIFPSVDRAGLKGGAVWYDAWMPDPQRLLIEALRWTSKLGGTALNYMEASKLCKSKNRVAGVEAVDRISGQRYEFRANVVVNATGPWCRQVAERFDRDRPSLLDSSLAWNVLFDREALSSHAVAVALRRSGSQTYFLLPWKGKLLAGTGHAPWAGNVEKPVPSESQLHGFVDDLNYAIPGLNVRSEDILRIFAGLLPTAKPGTAKLAVREVILDHTLGDGPQGLYSICGVRFTTSRLVAERTLTRMFPKTTITNDEETAKSRQPDARASTGIYEYSWRPSRGEDKWKTELQHLIAEESVCHLDDLVLRRTSLGDNPDRALQMSTLLCSLFDWDDRRCAMEVERLKTIFGRKWPAESHAHVL